MSTTLQQVLNIAYSIISQGQQSSAYPTETLISFINKAQNDICYGNIVDLQTGERLVKQSLTFLEANKFYTTYQYSTLTDDASIGDDLVCTNTFPTAWLLWINGDIISYSSNDGTTISGIPTTGQLSLWFAHKAGTQVHYLDTLPTDFGQLDREFLTIQNSAIRQQMVGIDSRDLASAMSRTGQINNMFTASGYNAWLYSRQYYYSMIRGKYILHMTNQTGNAIDMEYQMAPDMLSSPSELMTIPDAYVLNTVPYMAVAEMLANRGETDEGIRLNHLGFNNIKSMYQFYGSQRVEMMYNQRVGSSTDGFLRI